VNGYISTLVTICLNSLSVFWGTQILINHHPKILFSMHKVKTTDFSPYSFQRSVLSVLRGSRTLARNALVGFSRNQRLLVAIPFNPCTSVQGR